MEKNPQLERYPNTEESQDQGEGGREAPRHYDGCDSNINEEYKERRQEMQANRQT